MADIALGNSIGHASISDEEREQWRSDGYELKRKGMVGRAITGPTDYEQIPELAERGQARAVEFFEMLNERFAESEYLAGDGFSVADITACVIVQFSGWIKSGPTDAHTNTERWYEVVRTRPSFSS